MRLIRLGTIGFAGIRDGWACAGGLRPTTTTTGPDGGRHRPRRSVHRGQAVQGARLLALCGSTLSNASVLGDQPPPHRHVARRPDGRQHPHAQRVAVRARRGGRVRHRRPRKTVATPRLARSRRPLRCDGSHERSGAREPAASHRSAGQGLAQRDQGGRGNCDEGRLRRRLGAFYGQSAGGHAGSKADPLPLGAADGDHGEIQRAGPIHRVHRLRVDEQQLAATICTAT